jgi:hypothetical protein
VSESELKQRLAAILAADVAVYSRLMAANERATVAALDAAPDFPQGHLFAAAMHVGLGEIGKARAALEVARGLAPEMVQARLTQRPPGSGTEFQRRNDLFLRVAAGLEDPGAAEALR